LKKSIPHIPLLFPALCIGVLALASCGVWQWIFDPGVEMRVMSFNIRQGNGQDGGNRWEFRKDLVDEVIRNESPDIVGLQEVYPFQLEHLLGRLPGYGAVGIGRDGGSMGEHCPILYRQDHFELLESQTFWLSDTPESPSANWGNRYRRICTWARLLDLRTRKPFFLYNTHLDHESAVAREKAIRLIMETIASRPGRAPFLLCGDFNAGEESTVFAYLRGETPLERPNPIPLVDTWRVIHPDEPDSGTVSRFIGSREPYKIDAILATPRSRVLDARILRIHQDGRYPSDHYPVTAHLRLR
jgi:endonuclease/exonuclease/phosphatase family metal-dependent hydrolase